MGDFALLVLFAIFGWEWRERAKAKEASRFREQQLHHMETMEEQLADLKYRMTEEGAMGAALKRGDIDADFYISEIENARKRDKEKTFAGAVRAMGFKQ